MTTNNTLAQNEPQFIKPSELAQYEPAFTLGGFRHLQFTKSNELEAAGVTVRFGRRLLINLPRFREWIAKGNARIIAGRGNDR
ncbi:MAG: hypothetical protein HYX61_02960 [Gammaproteobacteria bacterium]|nr:hypothetical protein [Gammaproteobacteria bacterium]